MVQQPDILIDGHRVSMYMPWGDLELVTCWPGGTESITFDVARPHEMFRPGALVEVDYGGVSVGHGTLLRPTRGEMMQAQGLWRLGEDRAGIDADGNATLNVYLALERAITQTGIPWTIQDSVAPEPGVTDLAKLDADTLHSLSQLLDAAAKQRGVLWGIDPQTRGVIMRPWGETPDAYLMPGVDGLGRNAEGYASKLIARYNDVDTGLYETTEYEDEVATERWGYQERTLTVLLAEGTPITEAAAIQILQGVLEQGRAKMGWERPIEVQHGDVVNAAFQPVDLWTLGQPAQTVEALGLDDNLPDLEGGTTAQIRVARTRHKGSTVLIEPTGLSSPTEEALAAAGLA